MDKLISEAEKTAIGSLEKPAINDENEEKASEKAEKEEGEGEEEEEDEGPPDADECSLSHIIWRVEYDKNNYLGQTFAVWMF